MKTPASIHRAVEPCRIYLWWGTLSHYRKRIEELNRLVQPFVADATKGCRGIKAGSWRAIAGRLAGLVVFGSVSLFGAEVDVSKLPPAGAVKIDYQRDIQPIFEKACFRCHGPERPKSRFRLDTRESALKGGDSGIDIVSGDSAKSPLIHYVARLVSDMEMPPTGKVEPLSPAEIGLLRAWIDQGVSYGTAPSSSTVRSSFSVSPTIRYVSVSGNEAKFREHYGTVAGWNGGLAEFSVSEILAPGETLKIDGRAMVADDDIKLRLEYQKEDLGFVHAGYEQFRRYYNDVGGYYPLFPTPSYSLNQDLAQRIGRGWIDFGLTLPEWPQMVVGYEYQFRDGSKSTLQWGEVRTTGTPIIRRNIYPAYELVDEHTQILKFDLTYDYRGLGIEDNFRAEFYNLGTERVNSVQQTVSTPRPTRLTDVMETHDEFRAVNVFKLDKDLRDWLYVSGGYLFSHSNADASYRQTTFNDTGAPAPGNFWNSQSIVFEQNNHVGNLNTRLGPWDEFTITGHLLGEWSQQQGVGRVSLDTLTIPFPTSYDVNLDRGVLEEGLTLRYAKIPFTVLFAEANFQQETIGQFEQSEAGTALGAGNDFLRDTDMTSLLQDYRVGFQTSPSPWVTFGANYRYRYKTSDYDNSTSSGAGSYPGFIRYRSIDSDEIEGRAVLRVVRWMKLTFTGGVADTEYVTATGTNIFTPGGPVGAGHYEAYFSGLGLVLTPWRRLSLSGNVRYSDSRTAAFVPNGVTSVVPYEGHIWSALASANWVMNENADLRLSYSYSSSDYAQNNFAGGYPAGIEYNQQAIEAGVTRRFKRGISASLQYGYYRYREPTSGTANDYDAHAVFATLSWKWPE